MKPAARELAHEYSGCQGAGAYLNPEWDDVRGGVAIVDREHSFACDRITVTIEARDAELRGQLKRARALIVKAADGGLTDYTEAENEPICGYCGYEVECCQRKGWDDDGFPYHEDNPCPGIEARAFILETKEES